MRLIITIISFFFIINVQAQHLFSGTVSDGTSPIPFANIYITSLKKGTTADLKGKFKFENIPNGKHNIKCSNIGFTTFDTTIFVSENLNSIHIILNANAKHLKEFVVTGTLRETFKDESPVSIDVISAKLFQKTSTPNLFEATAMVNGVKPQSACNVCNTGEIKINGLSGPYTLILIDGMPIVSGLSSVYGLMGIPTGMIGRLEVVKGPAAALYGSEAMGGVINVITKDACNEEHKVFSDYYISSWGEQSLDFSLKSKITKNASMLTGLNGYWYDQKIDNNLDGFTDIAIQKRLSIFNKIDFARNAGLTSSIACRGIIEDRWGGQTNWTKDFRGTDSIYAESIKTKRLELISKHQWGINKNIFSQLSYNYHDQNSYYGKNAFMAWQSTGFVQTYWQKSFLNQDLLVGVSYKNTWFDDNTVATLNPEGLSNQPQMMHTAGVFLQDEIKLDSLKKHVLLVGARLDYNNLYHFIPSPRLAYKYSPNNKHIFRINAGTGFRIVNVFTEDHLALTGARNVVFVEKINPEKSYNALFTYLYKMPFFNSSVIEWDASLFYYHFTNKIVADYDTSPDFIIYDNLKGYAFSRGGSLSLAYEPYEKTRISFGVTYTDVINFEMINGEQEYLRQLFSPLWTGTYLISQAIDNKKSIKIDLSGNYNGPMRLPVFPNDFRPEYSPGFNLINMQISKTMDSKFEFYLGCRNLLNFLPKNPIMRPFDPFDKQVNDKVNNPNGYTFDPSYTYASMQGRRYYVGFRLNF
jgi:outer membrane receptor for ferrienterochelin and colicins